MPRTAARTLGSGGNRTVNKYHSARGVLNLESIFIKAQKPPRGFAGKFYTKIAPVTLPAE
jgi:hypothetical protein